MPRVFKYRLYPKRQQVAKLANHLEACRWLYNHFLAQRITAYQERGEHLGFYRQKAPLPQLKEQRFSLALVHSQVLQDVGMRVNLEEKALAQVNRRLSKQPTA